MHCWPEFGGAASLSGRPAGRALWLEIQRNVWAAVVPVKSITLRGRVFDGADIEAIRLVICRDWQLGRTSISQEVCRQLDWRQPNGWLKDRACRDVLLRLEALGLVELPPRKSEPNNRRSHLRTADVQQLPLSCADVTHVDLRTLDLTLVRGGEAEAAWNDLVGRHHYLGFEVFVGRSMKYLIHSDSCVLGAIGWSEPSWAVDCRDSLLQHIGMVPSEIRHAGINNGRFLILPWVKVPNLASAVLSRAVARVVADWREYYVVEPLFLETYVDSARFRGTCYKAANWQKIGTTRGFGKRGATHHNGHAAKHVYLYPLSRLVRRALDSRI